MVIVIVGKPGNSLMVSIPKAIAEAHEIRKKDLMGLWVDKYGRLVYKKLTNEELRRLKGGD